MDKQQRFDFSQNIENYLEEHQVYDMFDKLLTQLLLKKPDKPIDFLIEHISNPTGLQTRRVFLIGPPGCQKAENAKAFADSFGWRCINVGYLLKSEVEKKTEMGQKIYNSQKAYHYVEDQVVIDLVKEQVKQCEDKRQSWIIQGFPRTKTQALALQKMGLIPDKFVVLNTSRDNSMKRLKNNLLQLAPQMIGEELEETASSCLVEYDLNMRAIREAFPEFIYEYDSTGKADADVTADLSKLLNLRYKIGAPKRPPRFIMAGPPGTGKSTQAAAIAKAYGLVHISLKALLKKEISQNKEAGQTIADAIDSGELIADHIVNNLVETRLSQTDCKLNGWVLEGFPNTQPQINLLRSLRIKPQLVFMFEWAEDDCVKRLGNRQFDPTTGATYNKVTCPAPAEIEKRLKTLQADTEEVVRKNYKNYREFEPTIPSIFGKQCICTVQASKSVEETTENLCNEIENAMRA